MADRKMAFLFDLNGTMIDDMDYHIRAWHDIFNGLGVKISMERMKAECYGKNDEVIERVMPGRFTSEEKVAMSHAKEREYQQAFKPHLRLLPGLDEFLRKAKTSGIRMAIGSAAIRFNVDFVLDSLDIRSYFDVLISADEVRVSKPDPETYLRCAEELRVHPSNCLVFEDSPKGIESAARGGMDAVAILLLHSKEDFNPYSNVVRLIEDYRGLEPIEFAGLLHLRNE